MSFRPDGQTLFVAASKLKQYRAVDWTPLPDLGAPAPHFALGKNHPQMWTSLAVSPDGK